jgi:hypothetical protein
MRRSSIKQEEASSHEELFFHFYFDNIITFGKKGDNGKSHHFFHLILSIGNEKRDF